MKLNKRTNSNLITCTILLLLLVEFFINDIGLPTQLIVLIDIVALIMALYLVVYFKINNFTYLTNLRLVIGVIMIIGLIALFSFIWNKCSIGFAISWFRLYIRPFVFFLITVICLDEKRVYKILNLLNSFVWINVIVCSIQYFLFNISGDRCNGLFGTNNTNSWMNVLLCIVFTYNIVLYINKCTSFKGIVPICIGCIYISSLAEIKFFYFEIGIIIILAIMLSKPNRRTIELGVLGILFLLIASQLIDFIWGATSSGFFSLEGIQEYLDFNSRGYGYASVGDIGRVGGIVQLNNIFFKNEINLIGMGPGACCYGTPFYALYSNLHYIWFGYTLIYLELGWCGVLAFILFFVLVVYALFKKQKMEIDMMPRQRSIYFFSIIMAILGVILLWYNTTIINYQGIFLFIAIAFGFVQEKKKMKD